ncbi:unnamed protein product [Ranitomeya imitator]|uniref:Choline transporter-like protein n=1 Tax=Ranitomeya imitator TaxID=111125 RepID=A0ABN9M4I8_9NEOB|nr:unnamed protein product [Ranitomeya imitator]
MEKRKKTKELSEDLRNQIVRKHEQSQGYKSISKDLNVPVSTVRSVIKKCKAHGTVANLPRCGRKRKIDKRFQRKIVRMLDKEPRLTSKQVQAALQSEGTTVSTRTIRRHLNEKGLYGEPRKYDRASKVRYTTEAVRTSCAVYSSYSPLLPWTYGDPRKVIYPTDSKGQFCGQAGTPNEKKPYLFYFNIMKCASPLVLLEFQCPTTQICVEKCPDRFLTYLGVTTAQENFDYYKQFCRDGFNNFTKSPGEVFRDRDCPAMITPSKPFTRRCFPAINIKKGVVMVGNSTTFDDGRDDRKRNVTDLMEGAKKANVVLEARQVAMKIFEDYTVSWYWIILGLVIAMLISLIFVVLLRFLAGIMVWVMIVLVIAVMGYGIFHCYMEYAGLKGTAGSDIKLTDIGFQSDLRIYLHLRQTWLAFMIILCIMEVIIILLLIFLRKRIMIAIALIKESSRAVGHVMCSLVFPLFTFFLVCLCIAYWAITAVFLSTSNEAIYKVFNETQCDYAGKSCNPEEL